jgi:hypothetical protein
MTGPRAGEEFLNRRAQAGGIRQEEHHRAYPRVLSFVGHALPVKRRIIIRMERRKLMTTDAVKSITAPLGVAGALTGVFAGLYQHYRAQRWKVLEFVAKEIKEFEQVPAVINAMLMLDYEGLDIERFPDATGPEKRKLSVDETLIVQSLVVQQVRGFTETEPCDLGAVTT